MKNKKEIWMEDIAELSGKLQYVIESEFLKFGVTIKEADLDNFMDFVEEKFKKYSNGEWRNNNFE